MRLINFLKFLLLLLCGFDAYANTCVDLAFGVDRDGVATNIASTETIRLNEVEYNNINTILADSLDVKFWVEECVNENQIEYSLISTIRPIEPGKSQGAGVYDLAIIQNNQQFDGVLYFTDNLYVSCDFGAGLYSFYYP